MCTVSPARNCLRVHAGLDEVAVQAAVSLPISDSLCACLVLPIDEGSVADGFSDISDDAHGYEAEEEEDDHADFLACCDVN